MNPLTWLTKDQITGIVERLVTPLVVYLVAKDYIPAAISTDIQAAIVAVVLAFYAAWINRPNSIIRAANNLDKVSSVVTSDKKLGDDPTLPKVISGTDAHD